MCAGPCTRQRARQRIGHFGGVEWGGGLQGALCVGPDAVYNARDRAESSCLALASRSLKPHVIALTLVLGVLSMAGCAAPAAQPFTAKLPSFHDGARIAVVGDVQRTSLLEFWRESNDAERELVVQAIADAHPDILAITGDCVFNGGSDDQWADFDALAAPLRAARIPVVHAFGNHEYWAGREGAESYVASRFPNRPSAHWYSVAFGPVRIVVLDSNKRELSDAEWAEQRAWYEHSLAVFDRESEARGVLVMLHHPAYTNSTITGDEPAVETTFVPALMRAHKTLALLSGHVHNYERFLRGGKMFVVSGGGGGPRAKLEEGSARRHPDDLVVGPPLRDFHFTMYTVTSRGLVAEVRGVAKGGSKLEAIDRFELAWPTP